MGFFDALKRVLSHHAAGHAPADEALARAWGLDDPARPGEAGDDGAPGELSDYDRAQWVKRLKRLLEDLPGSRPEILELISDARSLHFDGRWLHDRVLEEFRLMVRRAVSDRKFTEAEHRRLDLARDLLGIPEAEAEEILHAVVAEAEQFFGGRVEGA